MNGKIDSGYYSFDLRFAWQPCSKASWFNPYGFASFGFGWYSGFIGNLKVLSEPNALYGFMKFPFSRYHRRNVMEISSAFGLTFNLESFDEESNPGYPCHRS
ncbi:hypothetical protein [Eudoraea sp.]|uniref:hypothetical protein n=1 Tax=Eudoraea sp. TaxID=1979955 RepID=UPI003C76416F